MKSGRKREYDVMNMQEVLLDAGECFLEETGDSNFARLHVTIERAQAMPGQGITGMFNYGYGFGLWVGLLVGIGFSYTLVRPQRWKKVMLADMAKDKGASVLRAKQLFPNVAEQLKLVKDHNKAEALLLAEYGRRL